ncbi:flagellar hook protein FlgE [Marinobacter koreensis]|uniref:Flagellar hook protein FlgE n=1 Tax=Marinobacter koreensis TaxID=335974 RepID=A0ABW0RJP6_9GAMM|nr:flagellar hook protein FlgE [Marinobacter koreensis]MCK7548239.1 flagellar hook protein FlgE [Marinobacter koreensis]
MAFNTGLSGLRAASVDLDVTGNNIANASTVGFKGSRVQFGDLYASGFLSGGTNPIGDGVRVQDVQQKFGQGNISFTDNGLDMAISGDGFFMLNNNGEVRYSRAGQFSIDKEGYIVNNQNMKVQGYTADEDGNLSGIRGDLQIATDNLAPRRTTNLQTDVNLDSRESVLEKRVRDIGPIDLAGIEGEKFSFQYADGTPDYPVEIPVGGDAQGAALKIDGAPGVSATASTTALLDGSLNDAFIQGASDFKFTIKIGSTPLNIDTSQVNSLSDLAQAITDSPDNSVSASPIFDDYDGDPNTPDTARLRIIQNDGKTLNIEYGDTTATADPQSPFEGVVNITTDRTVIGVDTTDDTVSPSKSVKAEFEGSPIRITNAFNPIDQRTYNHATSTTIYDSLGNSHELTQFYVKDPSPGNGVGQSQWSIYMQIDGELVAGTDTQPYTALFDQDGQLESVNGDPNGEIIVTDWIPKDATGAPNGADGPPSDPSSVVSPIPEPPTTSAFVVDLGNTTQYGAAFGVNDQQQNGYTTGRLSGLDVSDQGVIFARYTNGQSQSLGQVALAAFNNTDGLSPVGDTTWVETFESGQPIIGAADTGTLGSIKASSVEESNVDLSAELVNLIIAQRNYQANAKTIETSDAVTQTIINLR